MNWMLILEVVFIVVPMIMVIAVIGVIVSQEIFDYEQEVERRLCRLETQLMEKQSEKRG